MARRGEQLREHILYAAKDVFIEFGYERTSMDVVAARAETSKRSLYAHFPSKDVLFGAVIELVRGLYLGKLGTPAEYGPDPAEAVVRYCGRLVQLQLWQAALRTLRIGIAEAERLPEVAASFHEAIFGTPQHRLADYLVARYGLEEAAGEAVARRLIGSAVYPELIGALLGAEPALTVQPKEDTLADDVDLEALRSVAAVLLPAVPSSASQRSSSDADASDAPEAPRSSDSSGSPGSSDSSEKSE